MLMFIALIISVAVNIYLYRRKTITYTETTQNRIITLTSGKRFVIPYSTRAFVRNGKYSVYLQKGDQVIFDITQPPGTMYPFSASQLGGQHIVITNNETNERRFGTVKPGYLSDDDLKSYD